MEIGKDKKLEAAKWAIKKYYKTKRDREIAYGLNMPLRYVISVRQRLGIKRRNTKRTKAFKSLVAQLSDEKSDREIARLLHVQRRTVQACRQRLGIKKQGSERTAAGDKRREGRELRDIVRKINDEIPLSDEEHKVFMRSKGYVV